MVSLGGLNLMNICVALNKYVSNACTCLESIIFSPLPFRFASLVNALIA